MTLSNEIVHISTVRPAYEVIVFHQFCLTQVEAGYNVTLIVHGGDKDETTNGVRVLTLGKRATKRGLLPTSRITSVIRAAKRLKEVDSPTVYLHDPELVLLGLWLKFTTSSRVIYDSQEDYAAYMRQKYFLPTPVRWLLAWLVALLETVGARMFDAVITSDEGTAKIFRRRGSKRVVVLHNFPKVEYFSDESLRRVEKRYDLVYHGSIPKYHLVTAFDVARELKERGRQVHWLFFGTCHDSEWARQQIRDLGLEDMFEIKGRVEHDKVASLVAEARIGFIPLPDMPKFHRNIPMKLFEFMALRMPTVLSDLPPSRPFVGDGECATMVRPGSTPEFADAIERLLDNPKLCAQMGSVGRDRVESQYNWQKESRKLLNLQLEVSSN